MKLLFAGLVYLYAGGSALAFRSVAFAPDKVVVTYDDGGTLTLTQASFPDARVSGFSNMASSLDHRYVGWQIEEKAIDNTSPVALSLYIIGPTSTLQVSVRQEIHGWTFLSDRQVRICYGPTHGPQPDTCKVYLLPE